MHVCYESCDHGRFRHSLWSTHLRFWFANSPMSQSFPFSRSKTPPISRNLLPCSSFCNITSTMLFARLILLLCSDIFATSHAFKHHIGTSLQDFSKPKEFNASSLTFRHDNLVPNSTTPERRWTGPAPAPADDAAWEAAICKGRKFMAQMSYSDYDVGQSLPTPQSTAQSPFSFSLYF
jgi:hypothetical protein